LLKIAAKVRELFGGLGCFGIGGGTDANRLGVFESRLRGWPNWSRPNGSTCAEREALLILGTPGRRRRRLR